MRLLSTRGRSSRGGLKVVSREAVLAAPRSWTRGLLHTAIARAVPKTAPLQSRGDDGGMQEQRGSDTLSAAIAAAAGDAACASGNSSNSPPPVTAVEEQD